MALNGVMAVILHCFTKFGTFMTQLDPYCLRQKCRPKDLVFDNIWLWWYFQKLLRRNVLKRGTPSQQWKFHFCSIALESQQ